MKADLKPFYCHIGFHIQCDKQEYEEVLAHYHHPSKYYRLEAAIFHRVEDDEGALIFSFSIHLRKTGRSAHLSVARLLKAIELDLKILQQLHLLSRVIFEKSPSQ